MKYAEIKAELTVLQNHTEKAGNIHGKFIKLPNGKIRLPRKFIEKRHVIKWKTSRFVLHPENIKLTNDLREPKNIRYRKEEPKPKAIDREANRVVAPKVIRDRAVNPRRENTRHRNAQVPEVIQHQEDQVQEVIRRRGVLHGEAIPLREVLQEAVPVAEAVAEAGEDDEIFS